MRLYVEANSKNNIGYTPDWLKISWGLGSEGLTEYTLTLDIQAEIDYSPEKLSCRCKGSLIPWTLINHSTGDETDLSDMPIEVIYAIFSPQFISEIIDNRNELTIGLFPANYNEDTMQDLAEGDVLSECEGYIGFWVDDGLYYEKEFTFEPELNIY